MGFDELFMAAFAVSVGARVGWHAGGAALVSLEYGIDAIWAFIKGFAAGGGND